MVQDLLKKCAQSMFCYVRDLGYHPTFFEFSPSKIEFTVFSENNAYDYGRFLAIIPEVRQLYKMNMLRKLIA